MDLNDFVLENLGIDLDIFGNIYTFVDFGNVNYWYEKDRQPFQGKILNEKEKIIVDIQKLGSFIDLFSQKKFFYYGHDANLPPSLHIKTKAEKIARFKTITKPIQRVKHYLDDGDNFDKAKVDLKHDKKGDYILIPKCNFDVELAVDAIRYSGKYDTFALMTSDRDFIALLKYIRGIGKKVILYYSGPTARELKDQSDLAINGRQIRELISTIKRYQIEKFR